MIKHLIVGLIKNLSLHKMRYYPKPDSYERNKIKVELHLSNYATKSYLKGETGIDSSEFNKRADLTSLKSKLTKIDVDKLETRPTNLSKLSNLEKIMLLKIPHMMNWLKKLIKLIQTNKFLKKGLKMLINRFLISGDLL